MKIDERAVAHNLPDDFRREIDEWSAQHRQSNGGEISQFLLDTQQYYKSGIKRFTNGLVPDPSFQGWLSPLKEAADSYLEWLHWINWNVAELSPIVKKATDKGPQILSLSTMAYCSGRLIDDGFDNHENFKTHHNTLVGFFRHKYAEKRPSDALVNSVYIGLFLFYHVIERFRENHMENCAKLITKLFNISSIGLLAELVVEKDLTIHQYLQIVRRKAVAYNMILYKPFLDCIEYNLKQKIFAFLSEMDELAQMLNDIMDCNDDFLSNRMNILNFVKNGRHNLQLQIDIKIISIRKLILEFDPEVRGALATMFRNLKIETTLETFSISQNKRQKIQTINRNIRDRLHQAISKGIQSIIANQLSNGEFETYWSEYADMKNAVRCSSPFITGLILFILSEVPEKELRVIKDRSFDFIKSGRKKNGYFSFFSEGIDDDLDDTCLLNYVLQRKEGISEYYQKLASKVSASKKSDGLYYTWVRRRKDNSNDIDETVNLNIVRFLALNKIDCRDTLKALKKYALSDRLLTGSLYYHPELSFIYFLSSLEEKIQTQIIDKKIITNSLKPAAFPRTIINIAMKLFCASTLNESSSIQREEIDYLLSKQQHDGSWPAEAFFRAFNFWGSRELTTALCIQSLHRCANIARSNNDKIRG
jgi:hypothetical protein